MKATAILFGRGQRHYRDDDDAVGLVEVMRRRVAEEWRAEFGHGAQVTSAGAGTIDEEVQAPPSSAGASRESKTESRVVGTAREDHLPLLQSRSGKSERL